MWSCGVIIFLLLLLACDLPFVERSQKELFRNIVMGRYEFEEESWSNVSDDARDLVRKLLVTDPSRRLSSREAMASPWMRTRGNMLARNNLQYTSQVSIAIWLVILFKRQSFSADDRSIAIAVSPTANRG